MFAARAFWMKIVAVMAAARDYIFTIALYVFYESVVHTNFFYTNSENDDYDIEDGTTA